MSRRKDFRIWRTQLWALHYTKKNERCGWKDETSFV